MPNFPKAITINQPWASLIVRGRKRLETRLWPADYRGPLIVHAARHAAAFAVEFAEREHVRDALGGQAWSELPFGSIIGWVQIDNCYQLDGRNLDLIPFEERRLGDFRAQRWVWELSKPYELIKPVALRGEAGLWAPPVDFTDLERYPARAMDGEEP